MLDKQDKSTTIEENKKKTVSWNDQKTEGKIDEGFLTVEYSASPSNKKLLEEISKLVSKGYSEVEAATLAGRATTRTGEVIVTNPIYYESKASIQERRFSREQTSTSKESSASNKTPKTSPGSAEKPLSSESEETGANRYNFFSPMNIGLGIAVAVATTIGIVATRK